MEWVETTGKTVQDAIELALDQLGVDQQDAEVVVLEEGRAGFLGLGRTEARVQVRVRPSAPRPKRVQRNRRTRGKSSTGERNERPPRGERPSETTAGLVAEGPKTRQRSTGRVPRDAGGGSRNQNRKSQGAASEVVAREANEENAMPVEEQAAVVEQFIRGVVDRFGYTDATTTTRVEDEQIIVEVEGGNLGLLIGQRGTTLDALQELARTSVQRRGDEHAARVTVDVAGFRAKRAAALATFVTKVAEDVLRTGTPEALEPMAAPDRKVVHDTVNAIDGVMTTSEGVEPRRYVVIRPEVSAGVVATASPAEDDTDQD